MLSQQVSEVSESSSQVLQPVLQVEVFLFQGVDGVLQLIGWAGLWKQTNKTHDHSGLQRGEHDCGACEQLCGPNGCSCLQPCWVSYQLHSGPKSRGNVKGIRELACFCIGIDWLSAPGFLAFYKDQFSRLSPNCRDTDTSFVWVNESFFIERVFREVSNVFRRH